MIQEEVKWLHEEINHIVMSSLELVPFQNDSNNPVRCSEKLKNSLKHITKHSSPKMRSKAKLALCLEMGYDWDCEDAYMTTGVNGTHSASFSIKIGDDLWMNTNGITNKLVDLSKNFPGWRCLCIERIDQEITISLYGGKYSWATYCY